MYFTFLAKSYNFCTVLLLLLPAKSFVYKPAPNYLEFSLTLTVNQAQSYTDIHLFLKVLNMGRNDMKSCGICFKSMRGDNFKRHMLKHNKHESKVQEDIKTNATFKQNHGSLNECDDALKMKII